MSSQRCIDLTRYRKTYPFYRQEPVILCAAEPSPPTPPTPVNDCSCFLLEAGPANNNTDYFKSGSYGNWAVPSLGAHAVEVDCLATDGSGTNFVRKKIFAVITNTAGVAVVVHENSVDYWNYGLPGTDFYLKSNGDDTYSVILEESDGNTVTAKAKFTYVEMG